MKKEKKNIRKLISDVAFSVFGVLVVAVLVFSFVQKKTKNRIVGHTAIWVLTESMEGTIPAQSYIWVKEVKENDEIVVGHIYTFVSEQEDIAGQFNTHRIIDVNEDGTYVTQGDNNKYKDELPLKRENIKGEFVKNMPVATAIGRFYSKPIGYVMSVVVISGLVVSWYVFDARQTKKAEKQKVMDELIQKEVKRLEEESKNK